MTYVANNQAIAQISETETESTNLMGPVAFTLAKLEAKGSAGLPEAPRVVAPGQSETIVAMDERISVSVEISFNDTPLTRLLLCLGLKLEVCFAFEGKGRKAVEMDVTAAGVTRDGVAVYQLTYEGTPEQAGLTPGLYEVSATVNIASGDRACAQELLGFGYISSSWIQVYPVA